MLHTRTARARQRREEILDAALEVFSTKGFHRATNQDIAKAAGIASPGLIYHYFQDKQDLLSKLLERLNPALEQVVSSPDFDGLSLRSGLLLLASASAKLAEDPKKVATLRLFLSEALLEPVTAAALWDSGPQRFLSALALWLQTQVGHGALKPWPCEELARQFLAPFFTATMFRVVFHQQVALNQEQLERMVDLFLEGATP